MLKLTYTETSFDLERLTQSLEDWVTGRVVLAMRVGQCVCVEPSTAAFLLPVDLPGVDLLQTEAQRDGTQMNLCAGDAESIEVSLSGSWLAVDSETEEGVFVTAMSDRTEFFLCKLWQEAQSTASFLIP
jgi:hypothetical protein